MEKIRPKVKSSRPSVGALVCRVQTGIYRSIRSASFSVRITRHGLPTARLTIYSAQPKNVIVILNVSFFRGYRQCKWSMIIIIAPARGRRSDIICILIISPQSSMQPSWILSYKTYFRPQSP